MKANIQVLNHFKEKNRISAYRFYVICLNNYNNHIYSTDLEEIGTLLKVSRSVIHKNIKTLIHLGIMNSPSKGYFRINSWAKFCNTKFNTIRDITLEQLRDLKFLRTLYYSNKYECAYYVAKKNATRTRHTQGSKKLQKVSASFVKSVTCIPQSNQCLYRHLKRAEEFDIMKVVRSIKVIGYSLSIPALKLAKQNIEHSMIMKLNGRFCLVVKETNKIQPLLGKYM